MSKLIYIEGTGCNRRLLEQSKIKRYLDKNGYQVVNSPEKADYILLTTCSFKKKEEDYSVARLKKMQSYDAELLVYGCLPDIAPGKFSQFTGVRHLAPKDLDKVDAFFDDIKIKYSDISDSSFIEHNGKNSIFQTIRDNLITKDILTGEFYKRAAISAAKHFNNIFSKSSRDYYLFVCRGCRGKCSYCAIERAIGPVVSNPVHQIMQELRDGLNSGYLNFIILGDDPGCYGLDIGTTFAELLSKLVDECNDHNGSPHSNGDAPDIGLHIKEIHPKFVLKYEPELLELLGAKQIKSILCPIQSGSNRILELMRREHSAEDYSGIFKKIKKLNPSLKLSTQIIAGFPSETEQEFDETLQVVGAMDFDHVVVFPYHDKEGTPASKLDDKLPDNVIKKRVNKSRKYFSRRGIKVYTKCPLN